MPAQHGCSWVHAYLCAYNTILALGWFAVACVVCARLSARADVLASMRTALRAAYFLQALSVLETLHALLKLVNSGVLFNILQWLGRAHALYLVVGPEAHLHASPAAATMLAAWGVGEACRYPWYAANTVNWRPRSLNWLRYSAFIPIYPLGLCAELTCIWLVLPRVEASGRLSLPMPNPLNIACHYPTFLRVLLVVQPTAWTFLYNSLLRQRARRLRAATPERGDVAAAQDAQERAAAKKLPREGDATASGAFESGEANIIAHVRAWHPSAPAKRRGACASSHE